MHNLRALSFKTHTPSLREVLQQPLWKKYFELCRIWNIDLHEKGKASVLSGQWHEISQTVLSAARLVLISQMCIEQRTISLRDLNELSPYKAAFVDLVEALFDKARSAHVHQEICKCIDIAADYHAKSRWASSFLETWEPLLSSSTDLGALRIFEGVAENQDLLTVAQIQAEVGLVLFYVC